MTKVTINAKEVITIKGDISANIIEYLLSNGIISFIHFGMVIKQNQRKAVL